LVEFLEIGTFYELSSHYSYKMSKFKQKHFSFYEQNIRKKKIKNKLKDIYMHIVLYNHKDFLILYRSFTLHREVS